MMWIRVAAAFAVLGLLALGTAPMAAAQNTETNFCGRYAEGAAKVFFRYECIEGEFRAIVDAYPDIAKFYPIGQSVQERPIWMLEIANLATQANDTARPGFYLDAAHHGNEIQATEVAVRLANFLVTNYGSNETVTRWVDQFNIYINPVLNPDGNVLNQRRNANNVDLNRNYPFEWCVRATACGSGPASEPETQANVAFMTEKDIDVYASLHTGTWDYVSPRCSKDDFRERAKTEDEELYEYAYAELLEASGMGVRGASGTGESICWAYDAREIWSILPEVSEEQFVPAGTELVPSEEQQEQVDGAFQGILWMLAQTGRFGAVLEAGLAFNATSSSGLAIEITNAGLQTARNWTFTLDIADRSVNTLLRGNEEVAPGQTITVPVPKQFLGGDAVARLSYDHLNVNPLASAPDEGVARDPFVSWLNFTREQAEEVVVEAGGEIDTDAAAAPGLWGAFVAAALVGVALVRRRR